MKTRSISIGRDHKVRSVTINAMNALEGRRSTKQELADHAIYIEQTILQENVGCQDQITTAYGGFNMVEFKSDGATNISPIIAKPQNIQNLQDSMLLFFTGVSRHASKIAAEQIKNFSARKTELTTMYQMVEEAVKILDRKAKPAKEFGKLLHESWMLKRSLANAVTNQEIDDVYEIGCNAGAYGGKLLGAGGGGFILFIAPPDKHTAIKVALNGLVYVNFKFDTDGSKVIVFDPEEPDYGQ